MPPTVTLHDAAMKMMQEIRTFVPRTVQSVILADVDQLMADAWRKQLNADNKS